MTMQYIIYIDGKEKIRGTTEDNPFALIPQFTKQFNVKYVSGRVSPTGFEAWYVSTGEKNIMADFELGVEP